MTATLNGRQKKTLSHQLDRLDSILDGLSDALQQAVADAVKEVVTTAVKDAVEATVAGLTARPELNAPHPTPEAADSESTPSKPVSEVLRERFSGLRAELKHRWSNMTSRCRDWWSRQVSPRLTRFSDAYRTVRDRFDDARALASTAVGFVRHHRRDCTVSALVGLILAVLGYFGGPELAALIGGLTGGLLALAGTVLLPLIKMLFWVETPALSDVSPTIKPESGFSTEPDSV